MRRILLFVYNADATLMSGLTHFLHRALKPETYSCNLCDVTYDSFTMKKDWRAFLESLEVEVEFLHRNEFHAAYPSQAATELPAAFWKEGEEVAVAVGAAALREASDLEDMKELVRAAIAVD